MLPSSRLSLQRQDLSHCTETSFKTLENKHKPLVLKDLRKIWDKYNRNLPWENGYYNESSTFLAVVSPITFELNATLELARFLCRRELAKEIVELLTTTADGAKSLIDASE